MTIFTKRCHCSKSQKLTFLKLHFSYAFKSSELDEVSRFPTLSTSTEKEKEIAKSQQKTEEIFAFPCLRMDLKTKHVQGEAIPTAEDPKPIVECTFVTGNS